MAALPWLQTTFDNFSEQIKTARVGHAYLIGMDTGYGGELLALELAKMSLCNQLGHGGACGFCKSCQLIEANNHPDLYRVEADGAQIKVDQVRELCQKLTTTAQQGGRRVAVVLNSERLNQASANALLKTLEEPGKDTILLLQANAPSRLIATISSRCQRLRVELPSKQQVKQWLKEQYNFADDPSWCLPVVGGPMAVLSAVENDRYQTLLSYRKGWTQSLSSGQLCASLINVNEKQVSDALKVLYLVIHRTLIKKQDCDPLIRTHLANFAAKVMQLETRLSVMPNVNTLALFEGLTIEYNQLMSQ
ncbi:DNA polymerase III subunit delta' [Shewanella schlegeliana]|uniref:DNA-directed DNA polymerase n=1 Tax=Shewanella schlegeliana TaxID=190308 RepID=A0ABS1SYX4_9GAMM|nr:DNA polymerase III subunit delta' [Shewanella schlegeliana]MBL4913738.1 DNA polymerase III subunit delta' [Shewanella schlegeliana]MCL1111545.1 DNA polymerase III subunit delta' [Shewanella schlegeliana]GIU36703.1 DNA polymerase III subunit delta' [Shewanella schlegeliana]